MADDTIDIRLVNTAINVQALIDFVTCPEAGGIDVFIGTTRAENDPKHGSLKLLDYSAYPEMALKELHKLADEAKRRWSTTRIALTHRLGPVAVGEASIVIAVSCSHRADAFAACRYLIDTLKETVPIWKKEVYDASARWQAERSSP
jgi:molybdopterin synthase catalytic subunit